MAGDFTFQITMPEELRDRMDEYLDPKLRADWIIEAIEEKLESSA